MGKGSEKYIQRVTSVTRDKYFMNPRKCLETFYGGRQKTEIGSKPRIPSVVSKPDRNHGTATMAHRTSGLMLPGIICHSYLSLSYYPLLCIVIYHQYSMQAL